ncbi:MAG TPA: phage major capsid protein [Methylomirabilota bacterium]|nr:phage major capsid protein [Methylomirabilota bacterium]
MTTLAPAVPETKGTDDLATAFDAFMTSFEAYRETNDRRLDDLDRRSADVLTEEKLARIDRALDGYKGRLDRLAARADRPSLSGGPSRGTPDLEHRAAFDAYVRSGQETGLRALEAKAMSSGAGADGGYTVTAEMDAEIGRRLPALSPIRSIAAVRQVSSGTFKKPYRLTGPAVGWVGETAARPETASPQLGELTFPTMELYAMPSATQALLDDSAVDLETWLAEEIELAFALQEGDAFVNGDGVTRPKGFLDVPVVAEAAWAWGSLGSIASGAAGAFAAVNGSDALVDLVYALKPGYRQNAAFVMNRRTQAAVRKLKDTAGNYLWQPPATPDGRASLMGFPLTEVESMPDIAPDAPAIAFGDFRRGYLVVDRMGTRVLRDPYSAKPYVLFYVTRRVGGGVQDFDAIKLMTFGAA